MQYFLGIDGGGSKTSFIVIDENENIVFNKQIGPSSIDTVPFSDTILHFEDVFKSLNLKVSKVFLGIGGICSNKDKEMVEQAISKMPNLTSNCIIKAENDVTNALRGAVNRKNGIVLIAGTGSVAYGLNNGHEYRVGGYGYKEGDAGSSYDLGHHAIQYLAKVIDGRKKPSKFSDDLAKETNCFDRISFTNYVNNSSRTDIAKLAKIVTKNQDDENARLIIENAVNEVLEMIKAVYVNLNFTKTTYFSIVGSLGNADTLYKKLLLAGLKENLPNIVFQQGVYEASFGSALLAKEL